jgi:hypothetical protein
MTEILDCEADCKHNDENCEGGCNKPEVVISWGGVCGSYEQDED